MPNVLLERILCNGEPSAPQVGDRFVYDRGTGYAVVYRHEGEVEFILPGESTAVRRLFLGGRRADVIVAAFAEYYAQLGGLSGRLERIEGSFESLVIFELVP